MLQADIENPTNQDLITKACHDLNAIAQSGGHVDGLNFELIRIESTKDTPETSMMLEYHTSEYGFIQLSCKTEEQQVFEGKTINTYVKLPLDSEFDTCFVVISGEKLPLKKSPEGLGKMVANMIPRLWTQDNNVFHGLTQKPKRPRKVYI